MGKLSGFMEIPRETPKERHALERLKDWDEYYLSFSDEKLQNQGARCMDCGTPFCHMGTELGKGTAGCPLYNLIPEWNDLVYRGRWREALDRLLQTNNFPEFTGRVCPAPCEGACTVSINDDPVAIKSIERAIIDKGFEEGWMTPNPPAFRTGKKVAVIGSGPAGLAAAEQLNKEGHSVTVFEKADRLGGLLMYGIPTVKLDKKLIDRRVKLMEDEGVVFKTNTEIGKNVTQEQLDQEFDAVIMCTGATKHRDLQIEGRELKGIHYAMDFLTQNTKSLLDSNHEDGNYISAKGKNVVVIGGGDTGADCISTALRHDCASIVQFGKHPVLPNEREESNPWPEFPFVFSLDYAHEEATEKMGEDPRHYLIETTRFIGNEAGELIGVETVRMEKVVAEDGSVTFNEVKGTEQFWPADLVFIAIGFAGPDEDVIEHFNLEQTYRSTVKAKFGDYRTNVEGVFAAGDVRRGQSLIVWAIQEGRQAAEVCNQYLEEKEALHSNLG